MSSSEVAPTSPAAEDAEMTECDGAKVVTMMDVLQEQQDFEDDANAVLGASDEKNCTYPKGYIKRQAIYACLTCCTEAKTDPTKRAGVCLACSLSCHENHELVELYTKRNFCCDCGNPKFNSNPCQFLPQKPDMNTNNSYNQNFAGLYCTCHRPYPDPDATFEDEMIQCIICEDWLHSSHLEATVPPIDQYSEMICKGCMQKNEFLHDYSNIAVNVDIDVDVVTVNGNDVSKLTNGDKCKGDSDKKEEASNGDVEMTETKESSEENASVRKETESGSEEETKTNDSNEQNIDPQVSNVPLDEQKQNDTGELQDGNESKETNEHAAGSADQEESNKIENGAEEIKNDEPKTDSVNESESENKLLEGDDDSKTIDEKIDSLNDDKASKDNTSEDVKHNDSTAEGNDNAPQDSVAETKVENEKENDNSTEKPSEDKCDENPDCTNNSNIKDDVLENIDKIINNEDSEKSKDIEMKENDSDTKLTQNDNEKSDVGKSDSKRKLDEDVCDDNAKKPKLDNCIRPSNVTKKFKGATFWPSDFRQKLCNCNECITMYKDLSVLYLIDPDDTVTAYETLGKERTEGFGISQYEKGLQALSSLDRIQQINALTEYNRMRDKLLEFLKSFKDRKEIVKEEDIKAFFAGMKPKREPDGVYFCR